MQHVRQFESVARDIADIAARDVAAATSRRRALPFATNPPSRRWKSAATGMTCCRRRSPHRHRRRRLRRPRVAGRRDHGSATQLGARAACSPAPSRRCCSSNSTRRHRLFRTPTAPRCSWRSWTPNPASCNTATPGTCPRTRRRTGSGTTLLTDARSVPLAVRRDEPSPASLAGAAARLYADAVHRRLGRAASTSRSTTESPASPDVLVDAMQVAVWTPWRTRCWRAGSRIGV